MQNCGISTRFPDDSKSTKISAVSLTKRLSVQSESSSRPRLASVVLMVPPLGPVSEKTQDQLFHPQYTYLPSLYDYDLVHTG